MSQETLPFPSQAKPDLALPETPTDILIKKIRIVFKEDEATAQKEVDTLRQLRNGILSLEAYYLMMLKTTGQRSVKTLSAQGALLGHVKAFAAHLERIGLDPADYNSVVAIIALFPKSQL